MSELGKPQLDHERGSRGPAAAERSGHEPRSEPLAIEHARASANSHGEIRRNATKQLLFGATVELYPIGDLQADALISTLVHNDKRLLKQRDVLDEGNVLTGNVKPAPDDCATMEPEIGEIDTEMNPTVDTKAGKMETDWNAVKNAIGDLESDLRALDEAKRQVDRAWDLYRRRSAIRNAEKDSAELSANLRELQEGVREKRELIGTAWTIGKALYSLDGGMSALSDSFSTGGGGSGDKVSGSLETITEQVVNYLVDAHTEEESAHLQVQISWAQERLEAAKDDEVRDLYEAIRGAQDHVASVNGNVNTRIDTLRGSIKTFEGARDHAEDAYDRTTKGSFKFHALRDQIRKLIAYGGKWKRFAFDAGEQSKRAAKLEDAIREKMHVSSVRAPKDPVRTPDEFRAQFKHELKELEQLNAYRHGLAQEITRAGIRVSAVEAKISAAQNVRMEADLQLMATARDRDRFVEID